jgi:hypothetical protein
VSGRTDSRLAAVVGLALGGVLAGHALTYRLLEPAISLRRSTLAATGHGYLPVANRLAVTVAVAAAAGVVLARLFGAVDREPGVGWLLRRLLPVQLGAFAAMEAIERVAAGAPVRDLPRVLGVGLAIQAALAIAAAIGLRSLWRTAARAAEALGRAATPPSPAALAPLLVPLHLPSNRTRDERPAARAPPHAH